VPPAIDFFLGAQTGATFASSEKNIVRGVFRNGRGRYGGTGDRLCKQTLS
jgi:hypothetical protein